MTKPLFPAVVAVSGGVQESVGWFRYQVATESWTWSAGLYEIHGFEPGEIVPTTGVLAARKHPDDRSPTDQVLAAVLVTGSPFCCRHRIIDRHGRVRTVVSIGQGTLDDAHRVIDLHGYFVDITDADRAATAIQIRQAIEDSASARADIEQAKGALMLVHGISANDAFQILNWHSQHANVKLRVLAKTVTDGISEPTADEPPEQRISRLLAAVVTGYSDKWRQLSG